MVDDMIIGPDICGFHVGMYEDELENISFKFGYTIKKFKNYIYFPCKNIYNYVEDDESVAIGFCLVSNRVSEIMIINWKNIADLQDDTDITFNTFVDNFFDKFLSDYTIKCIEIKDDITTIIFDDENDWNIKIDHKNENISIAYIHQNIIKF